MCCRRFSGLPEDSPASVSCPEAKAQPSCSQVKPDTDHCQLVDLMVLSGLAIVSFQVSFTVEQEVVLVPESLVDNSMSALSCIGAGEELAESLVV